MVLKSQVASSKTVTANIHLPNDFAPPGGLVLRLRVPKATLAGGIASVTIGSKPFAGFNKTDETVTISAAQLAVPNMLQDLQTVVVHFA